MPSSANSQLTVASQHTQVVTHPKNIRLPPTSHAVNAPHVQDTECQERRDNAGALKGNPEERQPSRKLSSSVEVAQVEDVVGDETTFLDVVMLAAMPRETRAQINGVASARHDIVFDLR